MAWHGRGQSDKMFDALKIADYVRKRQSEGASFKKIKKEIERVFAQDVKT
jgi:hypothetical protein